MSIYEPNEPTEQTFSQWRNPTADTVTVDAYVGPGVVKGPTNRVRYRWAPGETKTVPSDLDRAIHQIDLNGIIVGGYAPQLVKVGSSHMVAHALDVNEQNRRQQLRNAEMALVAKKAAEEALVVATANMSVADIAKDATAMRAAVQAEAEVAAKVAAATDAELVARDALLPLVGGEDMPAPAPGKTPPKGRM